MRGTVLGVPVLDVMIRDDPHVFEQCDEVEQYHPHMYVVSMVLLRWVPFLNNPRYNSTCGNLSVVATTTITACVESR